jgi:prophage maintenance system killer protein
MIPLIELEPRHVVGMNLKAIQDAHRKDPTCTQSHQLVRPHDLQGCLGSIFFQTGPGYVHLPIEKMAGLLLYRIAEGQFFLDGNKRTALLATFFFLRNNGYQLYIDEPRLDDLIWGFAKDPGTGIAKYSEADAIQYMFDNIMP